MNPDETFGPVVKFEVRNNPYEVVIQLGDGTYYSCYPRLKPPSWAIYRHARQQKNAIAWGDNPRIGSDTPLFRHLTNIIRLAL